MHTPPLTIFFFIHKTLYSSELPNLGKLFAIAISMEANTKGSLSVVIILPVGFNNFTGKTCIVWGSSAFSFSEYLPFPNSIPVHFFFFQEYLGYLGITL